MMMNNNFIFTKGTIKGMEVFTETVKSAMETYFGKGVRVTVVAPLSA